ncbi:MAG: ubiquinol-cytochrome c reductase iron-sulfur subunit [Bacteroidota bacterium]
MNRKTFLKHSLLFTAASLGGASLTSCSLFDEPEMELCMASEIAKNQFRSFVFNRRKILVRNDGDQFVIFSLICTHKRCTVAYQPEENIFECPCHEGTYDREGRVIDGPPPGPLRRFAYEIREGKLFVLNKAMI